MGRFRTTEYQTVVGPGNAQGVLPYTASQVGAGFDTESGSITDATSDYAYVPEVSTEQTDTFQGQRPGSHRRVRSRGGRTPFVYAMPQVPTQLQLGQPDGKSSQNHGMTGAPDLSPLDTPDHGPWNETFADGRIPISPSPKHATWFGKWFGDLRTKQTTAVIKALGAPTTEESEQRATNAVASDQNAFVVPNVRQTFDTPAVTGLATNAEGQPYVGKAGRPVQDNRFMPMEVIVQNTRDTLETDSPPFLPDRTRAGAADPLQSRPSQMPHWWFFRAFDQEMAQTLSGLKGVMRDPTAARPIATFTEAQSDIAHVHTGQHGTRFMTPAPGMSPSGPMPNVLRQTPSPWDADLYTTQVASRNRNFRGRR